MSKKCVIIIPIYKETPNKTEINSFKQVLKILSNYDIKIITYRELDIRIYQKFYINKINNISVEYFHKSYFKNSILGYNQLLLSKDFYSHFTEYEYILIYQLDAWVFKDELEYWCNQGYDYIGAPWFKLDSNNNPTNIFAGVGNGGLSLRKIDYCLKVLNYPRYIPFLKSRYLLNNNSKIKAFLKIIGINNTLSFYFKNNIYEDCIFGVLSKNSYLKTNIPKEDIALRFSFEMNPSILWELNNKELPFGCHAFEKNEYDKFWKNYIIKHE